MFPRNRVTGVTGGVIRTEPNNKSTAMGFASRRNYSEGKTQVQAALGGVGMPGAGNSLSINSYWSSQYQYYMTGLIPAEPSYTDTSQLNLFYRDIYLNDNVAGSAVDIQSTFPFSDFDLRGLDEADLHIYKNATDQLNIRRLMPLLATAYLVDGFFAGSLVFDGKTRRFMDIMVHDALQCAVIPTPFFNMQPTINVTVGQGTQRIINSDSEYAHEYLRNIPQNFMNMIKTGSFTLNPASTLFVPRRSLTDRAYTSFLHRILPMYLVEKTMFRGTLIEASRRQRALTHLTAGDDTWTPTGEELQALVSQFQQAEFDPLGGWVSTRSQVQATDLRPGGDFWKWTDMADVFVAYKMRALGISEAFLSGDASYAAAESAYSTFLETQASFRGHMTNSVFDTTLFPLIAVANGLYKDKSKKPRSGEDISSYLMDINNRANLKIPQLVWHKSLEAKGEENTFELLEQASEKGVPIPLKAWMAAAGLDPDSLRKDLEEDAELRKKLARWTGKDTSHEGEDIVGDDDEGKERFHGAEFRPTMQSLKAGVLGKKPLLARNWGEPELFTTSRTGKKKHVFNNARGKTTDINARIAKIAARAEVDHEYRVHLAKVNLERLGYTTIPGAGEIPRGK